MENQITTVKYILKSQFFKFTEIIDHTKFPLIKRSNKSKYPFLINHILSLNNFFPFKYDYKVININGTINIDIKFNEFTPMIFSIINFSELAQYEVNIYPEKTDLSINYFSGTNDTIMLVNRKTEGTLYYNSSCNLNKALANAFVKFKNGNYFTMLDYYDFIIIRVITPIEKIIPIVSIPNDSCDSNISIELNSNEYLIENLVGYDLLYLKDQNGDIFNSVMKILENKDDYMLSLGADPDFNNFSRNTVFNIACYQMVFKFSPISIFTINRYSKYCKKNHQKILSEIMNSFFNLRIYENEYNHIIISKYELLMTLEEELISILFIIFRPTIDTTDNIFDVYYYLAYEITDDGRYDQNILFDLIVDWYYKDKYNFVSLANKIGYFIHNKNPEILYNDILYNIRFYLVFLSRPPNFNIYNTDIDFSNHIDQLVFAYSLSDIEIIELLSDSLNNNKYDQTGYRHFLIQSLVYKICRSNIWSIKNNNGKCVNENTINIITCNLRKDDPKEYTLSYGIFGYYRYTLDELEFAWNKYNLENDGFIRPDYKCGDNFKRIFSYKDIQMLIKYLNDLNKTNVIVNEYSSLLKYLKDNIQYADVDKIYIKNMSIKIKNLNNLDFNNVIYFFSMLLTVVMYARFYDSSNVYPYRIYEIQLNELNEDSKLRRDQILGDLILNNIKPYIDDNKIPFVKELKNLQIDNDGSIVVDKRENDELKINTLYGRLLHGLYNGVSCFGIIGELLLDNIKLYNRLFFKINKKEYNKILTVNVGKIINVKLVKTININKFELTHGETRRIELEDHY